MNSPKSIVDKLNLNKYTNKLILQVPDNMDEFNELEYDSSSKQAKYDLIFIFIFSLKEFTHQLQSVIENQLLEENGYLYCAYPKKNNKVYKEYIDRDRFMEALPVDEEGFVLESSLKFARMVSLNYVFTVVGLKSAPKKTKKAPSQKASQCVDDYIVHLDDIKQYLSKNEELLNIYNELTFGYQKDWARYVYSAKKPETQEKRLFEMESILGEGYKSMELYRKKKK